MECVLVRHGEAGYQAASDRDRSLTLVGETHAMAAARWLAENWLPELLIVSPYRRARQTAQYFLDVYPQLPGIDCASLAPDTDLPSLTRALESRREQRLLLVGHNPLFTEALRYYCGAGSSHIMAPASMACIEMPVVASGMGTLKWLRHAPSYEQVAG